MVSGYPPLDSLGSTASAPTMSQRLGSAASCDKRAGRDRAGIPPDSHRRIRATLGCPWPRATRPAGLASSALIVWRPGFRYIASFVASFFSFASTPGISHSCSWSVVRNAVPRTWLGSSARQAVNRRSGAQLLENKLQADDLPHAELADSN